MASRAGKVVELKRKQAEFLSTSIDETEIYPGFSGRLNALIDLTDLEVPPLDAGRQAYFAGIVNVSKMITGDWLKKDRPPKTVTLKKIVRFLLEHIDGQQNPLRVEIWLLYGDERSENPFVERNPGRDMFIPLAATLIAKLARELGIAPSQFDLNLVLERTVATLADFSITQEDQLQPAHRRIIEQHLLTHRR